MDVFLKGVAVFIGFVLAYVFITAVIDYGISCYFRKRIEYETKILEEVSKDD